MNLKYLENKKDKVVLEVDGASHTLLNIMRESAWKSGAKQATYMIRHPYQSKPQISVTAANPKKVLLDSAQMVVDQASDFQKGFKRALKK